MNIMSENCKHEKGWLFVVAGKRRTIFGSVSYKTHFFNENETASLCGRLTININELNFISFTDEPIRKKCRSCLAVASVRDIIINGSVN